MAHTDLASTAALLGAGGTVLALVPRQRAALAAGFALLVAAEAALAVALVPRSDFARLGTPLHVAALAVGVAAVVALAAGFVRFAAAVPVALAVAAPFRLPVDLGHQHAFLLLPLYAVLASASLALLAVVARAPFATWLPRALVGVVVGLACVFALIGLWQEWTHTVFFAQDLRVANTYASFTRVTSVFKDPSIYGRHLVLAIVLLLLALLLGKVRALPAASLIALIFAGLYFSYSQSSMAVLFAVSLAMGLLLLDRRSRMVLAVASVVFFVGAGAFAGAVAHEHSLRRATSGRSRLVRVTWPVIRDHPIVGVGVGSQPAASHAEAKTKLGARKDASHTTPLTVAAELGAVGVLAYLALLAASAAALRAVVRRRRATGLGLAAVFLVLF